MSGPGQANESSTPAREPDSPGPAPSAPRRRRWLRAFVLALALVVVLVTGAAAWLVLDPGLVRPVAERIATAATGRPVTIGTLDFRLLEGRVIIEATQVRVGQTTTERVSFSLSGMRSHARGEGVRFPNGSSLEQFRATLDLSVAGVPRISTVDATGAALVATRRAQSDPSGPPPLARLLIVPRILLGLGLERLVMHSGTIEYRGRSSVHTAGMSAVLSTAQDGLSIRGELLVAADAPPVPFDGTVRNPMDEDWEIDLRLTGDRIPMEGVRFMAGVLEPGPTVGTTLGRISNESRFLLSVRIARARIETVSVDFTFESPRASGTDAVSLEGVRFAARAVPDPAGWTVTGEVDWSRLPGGEDAERTPFVVRWSNGVPGSLRWTARRVAVPLLARLAGRTFGSGGTLGDSLERLRPTGTIDEVAAFGDPAAGGDSAPFWLSALVSGFGASAGEVQVSDARARVEFAGDEWRVRFVDDRLDVSLPSYRTAPYELTLRGELRVAVAQEDWTVRTAALELSAGGLKARLQGSLAAPLPGRPGVPRLDLEARLDDVPLADFAAVPSGSARRGIFPLVSPRGPFGPADRSGADGPAAIRGESPTPTATVRSKPGARSGMPTSPMRRDGRRQGSRKPDSFRAERCSSSRTSAARFSIPRSKAAPRESVTSRNRPAGSRSRCPVPARPRTSSNSSGPARSGPGTRARPGRFGRTVRQLPRCRWTSRTGVTPARGGSTPGARSSSTASPCASPGARPSSRRSAASSGSMPRALPEGLSSGVFAASRSRLT